MMPNILLVGGTFDSNGGKPSGYVRQLYNAINDLRRPVFLAGYNGGTLDELAQAFARLRDCDAAIWMADVPNDQPKLVNDIKKTFPKLLLVTSKRNLEGDPYTFQDYVTRALKTKSNLLLALSGTRDCVKATVLDPLGSTYCNDESDVNAVADALITRLLRLTQFTRFESGQVGNKIQAPDEEDFYQLIREQAERFHEIIHGVNHTRMMGNASFRCAKGFPSVRRENLIFVSQRDVDKRYIGKDAFVAVELPTEEHDPVNICFPTKRGGIVSYFGEIKPSVDTPIQVALYQYYSEVKYMLHSHTYLTGAPMTEEPVPCGALEEADLIIKLFPDPGSVNFGVNLRGHGSIFLANSVDFMRNLPWTARPIPELYQR